MNFKTFCESSFNDLFDSTVRAFPNTRKRQHATAPIRISEVKATPFPGVKTLFLKCRATNEDREYSPMILFKGVAYRDGQGDGVVPVRVSGTETRYIEQLDRTKSNMLVRCDCNDFKWRFNYYDHLDRTLYGNKRAKYEGTGEPANPLQLPGMCKHVMAFVRDLSQFGLLAN